MSNSFPQKKMSKVSQINAAIVKIESEIKRQTPLPKGKWSHTTFARNRELFELYDTYCTLMKIKYSLA